MAWQAARNTPDAELADALQQGKNARNGESIECTKHDALYQLVTTLDPAFEYDGDEDEGGE